jgi:hypothetical protein
VSARLPTAINSFGEKLGETTLALTNQRPMAADTPVLHHLLRILAEVEDRLTESAKGTSWDGEIVAGLRGEWDILCGELSQFGMESAGDAVRTQIKSIRNDMLGLFLTSLVESGRDAEELRERYGEFPLPIADPNLNQELQNTRREAVAGSVSRLRDLIHGIRLSLEQWSSKKPEVETASDLGDDAWLTANECQRRYPKLSQDAVNGLLRRYRNTSEGWKEIQDRKPREAKYLYRWGSVKHLFSN